MPILFGRHAIFAGLIASAPLCALAQDRYPISRLISDDAGSLVNVVVITDTAAHSHPTTDVYLDILKWDGDALRAATGDNAPGRDPFDWQFYAALQVVADGRLYRDGGGMCSPWEDDLSVCTVECDGGHFLLKRAIDGDQLRIDLVLSPLPALIDGDTSAAFRIGECGDGADAGEVLLDVAAGSSAILRFETTVYPEY